MEKDKKYIKVNTNILGVEDLKIYKKGELDVCSCGNVLDVEEFDKCSNCLVKDNYYIRNYSYKPTPEFQGKQSRQDKDNPIWYGIELEYGIHNKLPIAKLVEKGAIYLKSDTSILRGVEGGCEVVTHPYSFTELMKKDNWISMLPELNVVEHSSDNGCHIHVSKTAWLDDKHYALTYHLLFRLAEQGVLEKLGGREFTSYCRLARKQLQHITKYSKSKSSNEGDRSVWCNENNVNTVEFRFFSSTKDPKQ
jgi:hypothetical protein